ncbi:hypothetical protein J7E95_39750 [Streptomyces sp. ISL-14]|nr:hypothetical protein [Streptomyces sp. ISL-14]
MSRRSTSIPSPFGKESPPPRTWCTTPAVPKGCTGSAWTPTGPGSRRCATTSGARLWVTSWKHALGFARLS